MKTKKTLQAFIYLVFTLLFINFIISCKSAPPKLTAIESGHVQDNVNQLVANISKDISHKGVVAWLDYFEDSPDFFMAADGQMAFRNYHTAQSYINNRLVKSVSKINLAWDNIRVDPLTADLASVGAEYYEDLTDTAKKAISINGYFTATAHFTGKTWKLRNAHWSRKPL